MCGNCKNCCGKATCVPNIIAKVLVIVGGINWGLVGVGMLLGKADAWNIVHLILGGMLWFEGVVYFLVGVAAIMMIFGCKCGKCKGTCMSEEPKEAPQMPQ